MCRGLEFDAIEKDLLIAKCWDAADNLNGLRISDDGIQLIPKISNSSGFLFSTCMRKYLNDEYFY